MVKIKIAPRKKLPPLPKKKERIERIPTRLLGHFWVSDSKVEYDLKMSECELVELAISLAVLLATTLDRHSDVSSIGGLEESF